MRAATAPMRCSPASTRSQPRLAASRSGTFGNLQVQVGQTLAVDVKMRAAGVTETVTVTAESPLIDTRRTDVSNVIGEEAISNLPINGRRWENFVLLGPGVTNDGNFGLVSYRGISGPTTTTPLTAPTTTRRSSPGARPHANLVLPSARPRSRNSRLASATSRRSSGGPPAAPSTR